MDREYTPSGRAISPLPIRRLLEGMFKISISTNEPCQPCRTGWVSMERKHVMSSRMGTGENLRSCTFVLRGRIPHVMQCSPLLLYVLHVTFPMQICIAWCMIIRMEGSAILHAQRHCETSQASLLLFSCVESISHL